MSSQQFVKIDQLLGIEDENSDQYIFCELSAYRSGYRIRSDKKALRYSALSDLFRNTLKPHVCDIKNIVCIVYDLWVLPELLISQLLIGYL